jgi:hypothetical protein
VAEFVVDIEEDFDDLASELLVLHGFDLGRF